MLGSLQSYIAELQNGTIYLVFIYGINTHFTLLLNAANGIGTSPRDWDWSWVEEIFWSRQVLETRQSLFKSQTSQSYDLFHSSFYLCWHNSNFCLLSRKISMCLLQSQLEGEVRKVSGRDADNSGAKTKITKSNNLLKTPVHSGKPQ